MVNKRSSMRLNNQSSPPIGPPPTSADWREPELPAPKPSVTGYPMGAAPPAKLRKTSSVRASPAASDDSTGPASRPATPPPEQKFKIKLKTSLFDNVVEDSQLRERQVHPFKQEQQSDDDITVVRTATVNGSGGEKHKNIKVSKAPPPAKDDPQRHANPVAEAAAAAAAAESSTNENEDTEDSGHYNNDYCSACGGSGRFLCCESCPRSFHFSCVDPPLDEDTLPEGEWYCNDCLTSRHPPMPYRKGLFSQLLNQAERRNPSVFALPKGIQERFEGVVATPQGDYDVELKPVKKINKEDSDDPLKIRDKFGNPILCHRCKQSALNGVQMLSCEHCSLFFHVDCVNPPATSVYGRWKCPNHVDQATKLPRRPKKMKMEDPALRRGFKNNGNIEILNSEDEPPAAFFKEVPKFFVESRDTPQGVAAKLPVRTRKTFEQDGILYRLPEDAIKLDFIDTVRKETDVTPYPQTDRSDILLALDELATRPSTDREAVRDLCYLQSNGSRDVNTATAKVNLAKLIAAAFGEQSNDENNDIKNEQVQKNERDELLAIKKLIHIKGKDKLLEFLHSA